MSTKDLANYFDTEIKKTVSEYKLNLSSISQRYLLNLLTTSAFNIETEVYLTDLYQKAIATDDKIESFKYFKQMGDSSLLLSGFFMNYILRKNVGLKYYIDMGTLAYNRASTLIKKDNIYKELSTNYKGHLVLLSLVSESNKNTLDSLERIYILWTETKSPVLKNKLLKSGFLVRELQNENFKTN